MTAQALPLAGAIDVIGIGETMAVVTPVADESLEHADLCHLSVGGAESNVLMQLARAGLRTRFLTRVGADPFGRRTVRVIAGAGVDVSRVQIDPIRPTGVYFKDRGASRTPVTYYRGGSAAAALDAGALDTSGIADASMVYLTGITPALSPTAADLVERAVTTAHTHRVLVSFDVNHRSALWAAEVAADHLLHLARAADIVFVGLDEARTLWNTATAQDVRNLFGVWAGRLIVKDGSVGATEFHAGSIEFAPTPVVTVVEEVGAGDAFAAGYLAAWFVDLPAAERLHRGHQQAALALTSITDLPDRVAP
jgi:2-dehydro-3-deoxygluconokinase